MTRQAIGVIVATVLLPAMTLGAQKPGRITGLVVGADSVPVMRAQLALSGTALRAVSDSTGAFWLSDVPPGRHHLNVRMLGFSPASLTIQLTPGESLDLRVGMKALDPVSLPTVDVRASIPHALRGFEERRLHGPGIFLQYEDIARYQPREVTDVLRRLPGLSVRSSAGPYGTNTVVTQRGSRCAVMYFLNGSPFPVMGDQPIDNFVSADELVAVEVYTPSELPPQFNSVAYASRCGVVGLWTHSGHRPKRSR